MTAVTETEALALMLLDNTPDPRRGRRSIVLQPDLAAKALRELADGHSYAGVAGRCRRTKPWLIAAHKSGRLQEMAEGRWIEPAGP